MTFPPDDVTDLAAAEAVEARLADILRTVNSLRDRQPELPDAEPETAALQRALSPVGAPVEPDWVGARPEPVRSGPIGHTLVKQGLVAPEVVTVALERQRETRRRIGETLVEMGAISDRDLAQALATHLGLPFVDLERRPPDPLLSELVPEEFARRYNALPVQRWDRHVLFVMADPTDVIALDDLRVLTRRDVVPAFADPEQLRAEIERAYQRSEIASTLGDAADEHHADDPAVAAVAEVEDGPIVRLINVLLEQAIMDRASDLHIEPTSTEVRVRMRIDGVLHDASQTPLSVLRPLVSRLKVLGGLDIAQQRTPQDGRFSMVVGGRAVDVRVASVPTAAGESVVLRLLDPVRRALDLGSLGLSIDEETRLLPAILAPQGGVFITGPTGSGKTSTLYALLSAIDTATKSVVSVEDPVEYRVDGIKQIQINTRAGMTFPSALRSILRADPDVIMIGEVRDAETARIAADASITGHLVLSTLHTTRAAAAPMRLVDMGVEPYLVASSMSCIAAQRLARRLCPQCAEPREIDDSLAETMRMLGADDAMILDATIRVPMGCPACRRTGYSGRLPLVEIMPITEDISRLIVERAATAEIERVAVEQGMDTLRRTALKRVVRGELSIDEMLRVVS
ncbi:MAG: GspE/PulE family protein [Acidobacteriota bacterium]